VALGQVGSISANKAFPREKFCVVPTAKSQSFIKHKRNSVQPEVAYLPVKSESHRVDSALVTSSCVLAALVVCCIGASLRSAPVDSPTRSYCACPRPHCLHDSLSLADQDWIRTKVSTSDSGNIAGQSPAGSRARKPPSPKLSRSLTRIALLSWSRSARSSVIIFKNVHKRGVANLVRRLTQSEHLREGGYTHR
jgi:hypothetical protein